MSNPQPKPPELHIVGKAEIVTRNLFGLLGKHPAGPMGGVKELFDNSLDAGATEAYLIVEPDKLTEIDNGHGMVPDMSPTDYKLLQSYKNEAGEGGSMGDIRELLESQASGRSLRWFMESIAFSAKNPGQGELITGMRGIGVLAFQLIGNAAVWHTKPSQDLAAVYYQGRPDLIENPPVTTLIAPTAEMLARGSKDYDISYSGGGRFDDPHGNPLKSGTRVEISGLRPEISQSLRMTILEEELRKLYGQAIQSGRIKIVVIDKMSPDGRRTPGGIEVVIPGIVYRGSLIYSRATFIRSGRGPYSSEIYYDSGGRGLQVTVRRKGQDVNQLTKLEEFESRFPWNSGKLNGFVEYPDLPETDAPWDGAKITPIPGPVRNQWTKAIEGIEGHIETAVREIEERAKDERVNKTLKELGIATSAALHEVKFFKDLTWSRPLKLDKPRRLPQPHVEERVVAMVFDEYNHGVEGVEIELRLPGGKFETHTTGRTGTVSFGRKEFGSYRMKANLPKGMVFGDGVDEWPFNLNVNRVGFSAIFKVRTGLAQPEPKKLNSITIWKRPLPDIGEPYSAAKMESGIVEINTEASDYREALTLKDEEQLEMLLAQYVSSAISEYSLSSSSASRQLMAASLLFAQVLKHLKQLKAANKKK